MTTTMEQKENLHREILSLLNTTDIYKYKDMLFINKKWLRKIALAYNLSMIVSDNTVTETMFICAVRVSDTSGRHIEASACQKLTDDSLYDIEKCQSRSLNRAIYDFYSLQELDLSHVYQWSKAQSLKTPMNINREKWNYKAISLKQKNYLIKLIGEWSEESDYQQELIKWLDDLSSYEASKLIHEMVNKEEVTT